MSQMSIEDDAALRAHIDTWMRETREAMTDFERTQGSDLILAARIIAASLQRDGQVLVFGNGGSAADAQHMVAEMVGRMLLERRRPLRAIALTTDTSALTAIANDYSYEEVFDMQLRALGRNGDVAVAISTSGNSANVLKAVTSAHQLGMTVISLTGGDGGALRAASDVNLNVAKGRHASMIQETHAVAIHLLVDLMDRFLLDPAWLVRS